MITLEIKKCFDNIVISNSNKKNVFTLLELSGMYSGDLDDFIYLINKYPKFNELLDCLFKDNYDFIVNNELSKICSNEKFCCIINLYCIYNNIYINYSDGVLDYCSNSINSIPVLSKAEEELLFIKYNNPKDKAFAYDRILIRNLKLVLAVINDEYIPATIEFIDLISEGNIGLMKAIEKFDNTKGNRFSTYAIWWIRQTIKKYIIDKANLVYVPYHFNMKIGKYDNYVKEFKNANGRFPTYDEIYKELGYNKETVDLIRTTMYDPIFIESPITDDSDDSIYSFISDSSISIEEYYEKKELHELFYNILINLKCVSDRDKCIFIKYYGLDGEDGLTSTQLSQKYRCTTQRIFQVLDRILKLIKNSEEYISQLNEFRYSNKKY